MAEEFKRPSGLDRFWGNGEQSLCQLTSFAAIRNKSFVFSIKLASPSRVASRPSSLAAVAGLEAPQGIDGRSFAAVLQDPNQEFREWITHVVLRNQGMVGQAVRTRTHRLVEWKIPGSTDSRPERELYEVAPGAVEKTNIIGENPDVASQLQALIDSLNAKPQVNIPTGETRPGKHSGQE